MAVDDREDALAIWQRKLARFEKEHAIASDVEVKFTLEEKIAEARAKIAELEARARASVSHRAEPVVHERSAHGVTSLAISARATVSSTVVRPVDVLVMTVIPVEFEAARRAFRTDAEPLRGNDDANYFYARLRSARAGRDYRVAIGCIGEPGNVAAAAAVTRAIRDHDPKVVALLGIAGGLRGKRKIGDATFAERIVAYEGMAIAATDAGRHERLRPAMPVVDKAILQDYAAYRPDPERLRAAFAAAGGTFPTATAGKEAEFAEHVATTIGLPLTTVAAGEKLVRDAAFFDELRKIHDKVEVVEMEAAGFAEACERAKVPWMVVRGISDFGDAFKDDRFHAFAATTAAVALADFVAHGLYIAPRVPRASEAAPAEPSVEPADGADDREPTGPASPAPSDPAPPTPALPTPAPPSPPPPSARVEWVDYVVCVHGDRGVVGSGFRIGERHVVTCAHVADALKPEELRVDGEPATQVWNGARDGVDLAVLEVEQLRAPMVGVMSEAWNEREATDRPVVAAGRRGDLVTREDGSIAAIERVAYPEGGVRSARSFRLALTRTIVPGQSGGPVIDLETGEAIGVLTMRQGGDSYAVALSSLPGQYRPVRGTLGAMLGDVRLEAHATVSWPAAPAVAAPQASAKPSKRKPAGAQRPSDQEKRLAAYARARRAVIEFATQHPFAACAIAGVEASAIPDVIADEVLALAPDELIDGMVAAKVDPGLARTFAQTVLPHLPEWQGDVTICLEAWAAAPSAAVSLGRGTLPAAEAVMAAIDGRAMRLAKIPGELFAGGEHMILLPSTVAASRISSPDALRSDLVTTLGRGLNVTGAHPDETVDNINAKVDRMINPRSPDGPVEGRPYLVVRDKENHVDGLWAWIEQALEKLPGLTVVRLTVNGAPGVEASLQTALQALFDNELCRNRFVPTP